jgi:hypothetical protein
VFASRHAQLGTLVCWDQWFPEAARLAALGGAQVLFYPTAIGWQFDEGEAVDRAQHDAWETVQRGRAIANGVFVAAVNRVGREDGIRFWTVVRGGSLRRRARARGVGREETLHVECDLARIEEVRRHWPFLRDRRIDAYGDLAKALPELGVDRRAPERRWPRVGAARGHLAGAQPHAPLTWPGHLERRAASTPRSCARSRAARRYACSSATRPSRSPRGARSRRGASSPSAASSTCASRPTTRGCATRAPS